ncbi:MAG: hypothetical protein K2M44_03175 [Clostridia bacterium]|nr:hypothetical protein [Clostridia bacterium]
MITMLLGLLWVSSTNNGKIYALIDVNNAYQIGQNGDGSVLTEIYDSSDGTFDYNLLYELFSKVTGQEDATYDEVKDYVKAHKEYYTGYSVLSSIELRANVNNNYGIVMRLGGYDWIVTSLTVDRDDNAVATLWLKENCGVSQFNAENTGVKGNSVYSSSVIRSTLLSDTNFSLFSNSEAGGFAAKYLVQPKNIEYQEIETLSGRVSMYNSTNDAYGNPPGTWCWHKESYSPSELFNGIRYDAWCEDYIWLPSLVECGMLDFEGDGKTVWDNNREQREHSDTEYASWLRTGNAETYNTVYMVTSSGEARGAYVVDTVGGIRPAIHLNLKKAFENAAPRCAEPLDTEVEYSGTELEVATLDKVPAWFDGEKTTISYPSTIKEVGEYTCTVTIKPEYVSQGVVFKGTPDTSIGESDTVRKFKFKIVKKKITPTIDLDSDNVPIVISIGDIYSGDTEGNGRAPNIDFRYVSTDGKGYDSDQLPTAIGKYKAVAYVSNECPYEVDGEVSIEFELSKRRIVKPTIAGSVSAQYNAALQVFQLSNVVDSDVSISVPSGATYDAAAHTVSVKDAGKYKVRIELRDSASTQWQDGKTAGYDLEIEITKKPLKVDITAPTSWNYGTESTITIVGDCLTGDRTELYIYCVKGVGSSIDPNAQEIDLDRYKTYSGSDYRTRIITIPADFAQGDYTLFVRMSGKNSFANQNNNYELSAQTKSVPFTIAGRTVSFTASDIKWQYVNDGVTTAIGNGLQTAKLTYNGKAYSFSIDTTSLADKGVRIKTENAGGYSGDTVMTDAGSLPYTVTVYLTSLDGYEDKDLSFTLTYEIAKAKYDLSGLSWNYSSALEYSGLAQSVTLRGVIPSGLTVTYSGNGNVNVDSYTTTVTFALAEAYRNNYILPERNKSDSYTGSFDWSIDWEIVKAELEAQWRQSGGSNTVTLPKLQPTDKLTNAMVEYVYYGVNASGDIDRDNVLTEQAVLDSGTGNTEVFYYVEVSLKAEYADNYTLKFADGASNPYKFSVGENKAVIKLIAKIDGQLLKAKYPYRGSAYVVTVEITVNEGNVPQDLIIIDYYSGSTKLSGAPVDVGSYRVAISLKDASSAYVDADCDEYFFDIEKADFDVSGLRWTTQIGGATVTYDAQQGKWIDSSGRQVKFSYDGLDHTVTLAGADNIAGLVVRVSNNVVRNAGSHTVNVSFTYDTSKYNAPDFNTSLIFVVEKKQLDTKDMKWGYTAGASSEVKPYTDNLVYTRSGGNATVYTLKLMDIPVELEGFITYPTTGGEIRAASVAGDYTVSFDIASSATDNYEFVLPVSLVRTLNWKIERRIIKSPVFDGSWTEFDGVRHNLATLCGLVDGWENYVSITVKKDGASFADLTAAYDAGVYTLDFDLIIVDSARPNVEWQSQTAQITITVDKYTVYIDEWTGSGKDAVTNPDIASLRNFFEYLYTDLQGNPVSEHTVDNTYSTAFIKKVAVKSEYAANVNLDGEVSLEFVTDSAPDTPVTYVNKPTLGVNKITYDGRVHTIYDFSPIGFDASIMDITVNADTLQSVGVYNATIKLKSGINYSWTTGDNTVDRSAVELTFEITILKIVKPSDGAQLMYNGREQTYIPVGYNADFVTLSGNKGTTRGVYTATAVLNDKVNTCWDDGTTLDISFTWEIVRGVLQAPAISSPDSVTYNGSEYRLLDIIGAYDNTLIELGGQLTAQDAGVYRFTARLLDADNYKWDDTLNASAQGVIELDWIINKAKLPSIWDKSGNTPVIVIPDGLKSLVQLQYYYYDSNGTQVAADALAIGKTYKVIARLAGGCERNIEFVGADGETLANSAESEAEEFVKADPSKPFVPVEWDNTKNPPELKLPDDVKDIIHPEYEYKDKDGNVVKKEDLVDGEDYTVTVKIPDAEKGNVNFVDKDGNVVDIDNLPSHEFEKQPDNGNPDNPGGSGSTDGSGNGGDNNNGGGSGNLPEGYYDWFKIHVITEIVVAAMIFIVIVLFIVIMVKLGKKRDKRSDKDKCDTRDNKSDGNGNNYDSI